MMMDNDPETARVKILPRKRVIFRNAWQQDPWLLTVSKPLLSVSAEKKKHKKHPDKTWV